MQAYDIIVESLLQEGGKEESRRSQGRNICVCRPVSRVT